MISQQKLCPIKKQEFRAAQRVCHVCRAGKGYCDLGDECCSEVFKVIQIEKLIPNELVSVCGRSWEQGMGVERAVWFGFVLYWPEMGEIKGTFSVVLFMSLGLIWLSQLIIAFLFVIRNWCSTYPLLDSHCVFFFFLFYHSHPLEFVCVCVSPVA